MDGDVGAPVFRSADGGGELGGRVLSDIQRIIAGGNTAASHELDLGGTVAELFADTLENLVWTVGDHRHAGFFHVGERGVAILGHFVRHTEIAVAASLGNSGTGRIDARARVESLVDGGLEAHGRAAKITDGGEAAQQLLLSSPRSDERDVADVRGEK